MLHYLLSEKVWEPYGASVKPWYDDVRDRDITLMDRNRAFLMLKIADFRQKSIGRNS